MNRVPQSKLLGRSILTAAGLFCFLVPDRSFALDPAKSVFQYNCQTWTRREGLPANRINAITQTKDGYLWFGTSKGLVRFDGFEFQVVNLPDHAQFRNQVVSSLSQSRDGGLWFGINAGAFGFYDGQNFSPVKNVSWATRNMDVRSVWEGSDAVVWVAAQAVTGRLISRTNGIPFSNQLSDATAIGGGPRGRVWMGTVRQGLFYWQDGKIIPFPDESLKQNIIFAVAEDPAGQIWVGTQNGLLCYDADFHRKETGVAYSEVRALLVDRHGVVWIGTSGNGLLCCKNGRFSSFKKSGGLVNDFVTALFEDHEGSLWIGTSDGLSQLTDLKFPIYSGTEGLIGGSCHAVCASQKEGLWAAMNGGVSYFDGQRAWNYTSAQGLPNRYIKRVFEAKNGDVYLIDGDMAVEILAGMKIVARYTNSALPVAMAEDARGVIVSVVNHLFRVDRNQFTPYPFKNGQEPPFDWIYNLAIGRDGSLWVASVNGIFQVKDGAYQQWSVPQGLSWGKVHWVFEDQDRAVWAGLPTGMARLKNNQVRNITRADGLFDDFIFAIVPDDFGYFWVDSVRGIFRVSRQSLNDFADGKAARVQGEAYDGLEMVKTVDKTDQEWSGCKTSDGRIWFPESQGVVMIDPGRLRVNRAVPPVYIRQVRVNGVELSAQPTSSPPPGKGDLEFQYTALSYVAPQKVQFRCQLEGYDQDWIESGNRRSAFYTNLKPGKYKFKVQAGNADGVWNTAGDSFEVNLPPHLYQTGWFYLLAAGLASVGLMGIYGWRARHWEGKQRELQNASELLEAKVEERTAELEAQKTRLEREMEERQRMQLEVERVHRQLVDASRQAGQAEVASSVLHNVGNVLNSVNTSASTIIDQMRDSKASDVSDVAEMLITHQNDLAEFLARNGQAKRVTDYLKALGQHLVSEQAGMLKELAELTRNIDHIKEIVAMQQSYARVSGLTESQSIPMLVEDALRLHTAALARHHVRVVRQFDPVPDVPVDKHKVLQVLVNLISNAKYALSESAAPDRVLTLGVNLNGDNMVHVTVADNGVGIRPEHLTRIFSHGFTTRREGHGFGLHSGSLAARELGGALRVHSDGPGHGAAFTLTIPIQPREES